MVSVVSGEAGRMGQGILPELPKEWLALKAGPAIATVDTDASTRLPPVIRAAGKVGEP